MHEQLLLLMNSQEFSEKQKLCHSNLCALGTSRVNHVAVARFGSVETTVPLCPVLLSMGILVASWQNGQSRRWYWPVALDLVLNSRLAGTRHSEDR